MKKCTTMVIILVLLNVSTGLAADEVSELKTQVQLLQERIVQLETRQNQDEFSQRYGELVRQMVSEWDSNSVRPGADTSLTAGYDKGFFIKSADDQLKLTIKTFMQFRYTYALTDDGEKDRDKAGTLSGPAVDSSAGVFELERAKLILNGHVLKNLQYYIKMEMDDDAQNTVALEDYLLTWRFMPELGINVGRHKAAFGKQENTVESRQMLIDRSLANEVFNIRRGTGLELFGVLPVADSKLYHRVGIYNGFDDAQRSPFLENDNNPAVAARLELPLRGATPDDFTNESDLSFLENPVLQFACSFAYANARNENHFAGGEDDNYEVLVKGMDAKSDIVEPGGKIALFGADVAYKYQGLSVIGEGFYQHADLDRGDLGFEDDFGATRNVFDPAGRVLIDGYEVDNFGWYVQTGYFLVPKVFEIAGRISGVHVDNTNDMYEYAGGWNWYLSGQELKLSMDITYIDDLPLAVSGPNFAGVQNNSLLLLRSQLQFMF